MNTSKVQKYIFNGDCSDTFYEKLESFHDKYVEFLIMTGVAKLGTDIESIKMTKCTMCETKLAKRIIGGLVNIQPDIVVTLVEDKKPQLECIFTHINDFEGDFEGIFLTQTILNWPELGYYSCQIWTMPGVTYKKITEHWDI